MKEVFKSWYIRSCNFPIVVVKETFTLNKSYYYYFLFKSNLVAGLAITVAGLGITVAGLCLAVVSLGFTFVAGGCDYDIGRFRSLGATNRRLVVSASRFLR